MRRSFLLALSVSLVALAFASTAMAQNNYQGGGNQRMNSGGMGNMGVDHNMMASPASDASATAMSGATASPSASPSTAPSASPVRKPIGKLVGQRFRGQRHKQCRPVERVA